MHINPYFLRLNFTNGLVEDDASSAVYDPSTGYLTVVLTKEVPGQEFRDLDLLAKLLAPRPSKQGPLIEVMSTDGSVDAEEELVAKTQNLSLDRQEILQGLQRFTSVSKCLIQSATAAENDWQLPQEVPDSRPPLAISAQKHYGFLEMHSGYFNHVAHVENEVNELGMDAETCSIQERRRRRLKHEDDKWDEEYYM